MVSSPDCHLKALSPIAPALEVAEHHALVFQKEDIKTFYAVPFGLGKKAYSKKTEDDEKTDEKGT